MKVVLQLVEEASVLVNNKLFSKIEQGLLVLVGIEDSDKEDDVQWLSNKIVNMRLFTDESNKMNYSVKDVLGDLLLVSQFTLQASVKKGNRPSFIKASKSEVAIPLYEKFRAQLESDIGKPIITGVFGAEMKINLVNSGPITIVIDSKDKN
jgi:D-tyrosyl-tRNA(Tyr) deacylase